MKSYIPGLAGLLTLGLSQPALTKYHTSYPSIEDDEYYKISCPVSCLNSGPHSASWTPRLTLDDLRHCDQPVLFDAPIGSPINSQQKSIRACASKTDGTALPDNPGGYGNLPTVPVAVSLEVGWWGGLEGPGAKSTTQVRTAARELQQYLHLLDQSASAGEATVVFAKAKQSVVGLYLGRDISKTSVVPLIQQFIDFTARKVAPSDVALQVCWPRGRTFGIIASASGDIGFVQDGLRTWARGKCLNGFNGDAALSGQMEVFSLSPAGKARNGAASQNMLGDA